MKKLISAFLLILFAFTCDGQTTQVIPGHTIVGNASGSPAASQAVTTLPILISGRSVLCNNTISLATPIACTSLPTFGVGTIFGSTDGTGTATISSTSILAGNINLAFTPAGTGTVQIQSADLSPNALSGSGWGNKGIFVTGTNSEATDASASETNLALYAFPAGKLTSSGQVTAISGSLFSTFFDGCPALDSTGGFLPTVAGGCYALGAAAGGFRSFGGITGVGLTITGGGSNATTSINVDASSANTNIGTGSNTGTVKLGNSGNTLQIQAGTVTGLISTPNSVTADAGNVLFTPLQGAVPFIVATVTLNSTGAITSSVTLPATYGNAYMYFPAAILAAAGTGSTAGFYAVNMTSPTAGQVCSPITLAPLWAASPTSGTPTAISTCNTFTPNSTVVDTIPATTRLNMVAAAIKANSMGVNGSFETNLMTAQSNEATATGRNVFTYVSGTLASGNSNTTGFTFAPTTLTAGAYWGSWTNTGSATAQVIDGWGTAATSSAIQNSNSLLTGGSNTAAAVYVYFGTTTLTTWLAATDYFVLTRYKVTESPN